VVDVKGILWTDDDYESIMRIFGARTGLAVRPAQRESTQLGIAKAMRRTGMSDLSAYAALLAYDVDALDNLIVELTVGETYFFRESSQFEGIRREILPEILKRKGRLHRVKIWSAACASGEEPYSLAMLCAEEGLASQCEILATDISSEALAKARQATYRDWSLRGDAGTATKKYLRFDNGRYFVDDRIRRLVRFEFLNLAMDVYPSYVTSTEAMDLILCRNVLIYFGRATIREVAERLFACLADGGWLITASGDPPLGDYAPFETVVTNFGVFYRRPQASETAPHSLADAKQSVRPTHDAQASTEIDASAPPERDADSPTKFNRTVGSQLDSAKQALARGDYAQAVELSGPYSHDPAACILQVKALANLHTEEAIQKCTLFTARHPLSAELHYLHAVLLMELNLDVDAVNAAQRAVFLDRSLAIAHFLLGSILQRRGSLEGAKRAFLNARELAAARPPDEIVPLSEHETARLLTKAAENHLRVIEAAIGTTS
jgi:chemotaxis protein methyltransferase CheR